MAITSLLDGKVDGPALSARPALTGSGRRTPLFRVPSGHGLDTSYKTAEFHLGYRRWLDGLRGVAVLAVMAGHLNLIRGGFLGVDIFFVLSGFLITCLLAEEWQVSGSISIARFYMRRALRLLPGLFTFLLVCYLVTSILRPREELAALRKEIAVSCCYVANWPALHRVNMATLGHTWSLSLEEQFYLIWPVLLLTMLRTRQSRASIIFLVCAGIVVSAGYRAILYGRHGASLAEQTKTIWRLYMGLDTRADALLAGCLVGLLASWNLLPRSQGWQFGMRLAALACTLVLGYMLLNLKHANHQLYCGLFTVVALIVGVILVHLLSAPSRLAVAVLAFPPLVGIGRISYALYLFHLPIICWLRPARLGWTSPRDTLLVAGLSGTAATLSFFCVERPFLHLKRRFAAVS